jgi:hypothetical protein
MDGVSEVSQKHRVAMFHLADQLVRVAMFHLADQLVHLASHHFWEATTLPEECCQKQEVRPFQSNQSLQAISQEYWPSFECIWDSWLDQRSTAWQQK